MRVTGRNSDDPLQEYVHNYDADPRVRRSRTLNVPGGISISCNVLILLCFQVNGTLLNVIFALVMWS